MIKASFIVRLIIQIPLVICAIPFFILTALLSRLFRSTKYKPRLLWGPIPIISNKYWSQALKRKAYYSRSVVENVFSINSRTDYDFIFSDVIPDSPFALLNEVFFYIRPYLIFPYVLFKFDILHIPFSGGILYRTILAPLEPVFLKLGGVKTVVIPYGGDFYQYSTIRDQELKHVLLMSYPSLARRESDICITINRWTKYADCVVGSFHLDGLGRWDVLPFVPFTLDIEQWKPKPNAHIADGINAEVTIIHAPNHRGFKGTEFIIKAVNNLKEKGFKINFLLLEKIPNEQVRKIMQKADILIEQILASAYSMNAMEGMASGLAVIANLENRAYLDIFRHYSYLNECPIQSANIDKLEIKLQELIEHPELRNRLSQQGINYISKYHSDAAAQFLFEKIYDRIWYHKEVDLINLYHPILGLNKP